MIVFFTVLFAGSTAAAIVLAIGTRSLRYLADTPIDSTLPAASVVIAARNEAATIQPALQSVLAQQYDSYEVIVVDDRSTDATSAILDRMAADNPLVTVLHVRDLPPGWLGKNHALQVGAQRARGEYVLFTDADVVMQPTTLARAISYARNRSLDHVAVLPEMPHTTYWGDAFMAEFALNGGAALQLLKLATRSDTLAAGIGAFNLVKTSAYRSIGGHAPIRLRADDDMALALTMREAGLKQDLLLGRGSVQVEWISSLRNGVKSLEKNSFAVFDYSLLRLLGALLFHFLLAVVPWIGLGLGSTPVRLLSAGAILARAAGWHANARASGRGLRYAVVMLATALVFEYTVLRAATITLRQGGIRWRDTFYPLSQLRTHKL